MADKLMDTLESFLKSPYPIVGFITLLLILVYRGVKQSWPGFTKFVKESVEHYFSTEKERIEANVELGLQLKDMISTQAAIQIDLRENEACRAKVSQILEEVSKKMDTLLQGSWDHERTLKAYFKKTDIIYEQMGIKENV